MQRRSNSTACHHNGQRPRGIWGFRTSAPLLLVYLWPTLLLLQIISPPSAQAQRPRVEFNGGGDILSLPSIRPLMLQEDLAESISLPTALWRGWSCLLLDPSNPNQSSDVLDHGRKDCEAVELILGNGAMDPGILELYAQEGLDRFGYISQAEALATLPTLTASQRNAYIDAYRLLWEVEGHLNTRDAAAESAARLGLLKAEALDSDLLRAEFNDRLAMALAYQNQLSQAKDHFELAALYARLSNNLYLLRRTESNEAALLKRRLGDQDAVHAAFLRFLEARLASKDLEGVAVSLRKLATRNYNSDNLLEAAAQARDAVTIANFLEDEILTGKALTILGHTLDELGDTTGCRAAYRQALELLPTTPTYVRYWINAFSAQLQLETILLENQSDDPSRDEQLQALSAQTKRALTFADAMSLEQLIELHLNRSRLALAQGHFQEARQALDIAQGIAAKEKLRNWTISLSLQQGKVALAQGRLADADVAFKATLYEANLQGQLAAQWRALDGLASIHFSKGDRESALASLGDAAGVVERLWAAVDDGEGESAGAGARFLEGQIDLYDRAVEALLAGSPGVDERLQAWWWSERRRTGALRRQLGTQDVDMLQLNSQELAEEWLARAQARLRESEDGGNPSLLISYQVSARQSFIFVITGDALIVRHLPLDGEALELSIDSAFPFLKAKDDNGRRSPVNPRALSSLSQALWEPIADLVPQGALLRIIPDGRLALLPFELLPLSSNPKAPPLITEHAVVYGTSTRELMGEQSLGLLEDASLLSLAIGQAIPSTTTHSALPPLPCAREEGRRLQSSERDALFTDENASESRFRGEAPNFDILHVAVHGVISENRFHRSHLVLSPDESEDGLLTLPEIANLKLKARLAILPACQSAVARIFRGEGAQGVGSAFRKAGVASTAVGLWELPDVMGTVEINDRMIDYLHQGMGTAEALRQSKLDVMEAGASHRTWAPLVLYGSAEAIFKGNGERSPLPTLDGDMDIACEETLWDGIWDWFH